MSPIDTHIFTAFCACNVALDLLQLLPDTDTVDDLRILLETQHDLFSHFVQNKHYGSERIDDFLSYTQGIQHQIKMLNIADEGD